VYLFGYISADCKLSKYGKWAMLIPFGSLMMLAYDFLVFIAFISNFIEFSGLSWIRDIKIKIEDRREKRWVKKIELRERKQKIKLGIIKISSLDPYGEEDWD
jgi:energy-converting hydrogenase Eha subunit H